MNILDRTHHFRFLLLRAAAIGLLAAPSAHAADGSWNVNNNGNWSTTTNWLDDIIADGSGFTANFANDITADRTVTLDTTRTITNVVFGDSDTATAGSWVISGTNSLTLAGSTPTITVNALGTDKTATISAPVIGTVGLTKAGVGTLQINKGTGGNAATFPSGPLTVNAGTLRVNNTAPNNNTNILNLASLTTIDNGSTLSFLKTGAEGRVVPSGGITFGANGGNTLSSDYSGNVFLIQGNWTFTSQGGATNLITNTAGGLISMHGTAGRYHTFYVADGQGATDLAVDMGVILGGIWKSGAGVLTLSQANTSITSLDITAGTLELAGAGRLNSTSMNNGTFATNITNNGTLLYNGANAQTFSGVMSGSGDLTKSGAATLTLSGVNTYTGTTTVSAGTLNLTGNRTAEAGPITVQTGGTLGVSNGNFSLNLVSTEVFQVGSGSGTSTVNHTSGTISTGVGGNQVFMGLGGIYNLSGGELNIGYAGGLTGARGLLIGTSPNTTSTFNLSGTGHLNMTGAAGGLNLGLNSNGVTSLFDQTGGTATIQYLRFGNGTGTGVNSTLSITGGTFTAATFDQLASAATNTALIHIGGTADVTLPAFPTNALGAGSTATITFDGGVLKNLAASTNYLGSISSAQIKNGGAKFNTAAGDITINQALANFSGDTGSLTKEGANTLTLSGGNTYTGATTINAGTLALSAAGSIAGSSLIDVTSGGVFDVSAVAGFTLGSGQSLGGAGSILGDLVFGSGSKLVFSETNTLAMSTGTASFFTGTPGSRFGIDDLVGISSSTPQGTYTLISGTVDTTNLDNLGSGNAYNLGAGVSAYFQQGSLQVVVVPEPGAVALVGIGLAGVALAVTRRRRSGTA